MSNEFNQIIFDYFKKTGESPTHILVDRKTDPVARTHEMSIPVFVDVIPVEFPPSPYHYPQLPMALILPQPIPFKAPKKGLWQKIKNLTKS